MMRFTGQLSDSQIAQACAIRDRWMRVAVSTDRCDRDAATAAVQAAYAAAGIPRPSLTIWMHSPLGGMCAVAALREVTGGGQLRGQLRDQLRRQLGGQLWDQLGGQPWDQLRGQLGDQLKGQLGGQLRGQLKGQLRGQLWGQLWDQLRGQLWGQLGGQLRGQLWGQLRGQLWDQFWDQLGDQLWDQLSPWSDSYWLALYDLALRYAGMSASPRLDTLTAAVEAVGWWWPMRQAIILTDRPTLLRRDQQGRLHCDGGPALTYADGYDGHWWHGISVPADLVTGDGWAPDRILGERNAEIRRCAIERRGWDRFVHDAGLSQVGRAESDPGNPGQELRLYDLPTDLADLYDEPARILVCSNASLDRDGSRRSFGLPVPADVPDPISAAATTFGVGRDEYAGMVRAT